MHVTSISLELDQLVQIKELQDKTGRSRSAIVRDLIDTALQADGELVTKLRAQLETTDEQEPTTVRRTINNGAL